MADTSAKLKIKLLAHSGATEDIFNKAAGRVEALLSHGCCELVESEPDILFFLTGGSELSATKQVSPGGFYLLIGSRHDNSYASATEVKAWMNSMNIRSILLDEEESETTGILMELLTVKQALQNLQGKRLGLIGEVSDWLVASAVPASLLRLRLGIELVEISWEQAGPYTGYEASGPFLGAFRGVKHHDLTSTAKVSALLSETIRKWSLDAITVECFPLVQQEGVTACLPLARFNDEGIPAGCEGDLTAAAGMMLCRELTGSVPWIANINKATTESCLFSHCTIAPGLVSGYTVQTHFETGKGTAVEGDFRGDTVTIFRFDNKLEKAFIATAAITGRPKSITACRTQIEVRLNKNEVESLRRNPLGNHHLIFPGDCSRLLHFACMYLGIEPV
jgi:L-fucose isomerase-like protein